ncbi:MAG: hypothetical protein J6Q17_02250 [Clostridia bacterium]|nr:hypothetical protein [Clostridia bacterium]
MPKKEKKEKKLVEEPKKALTKEDLDKVVGGTDPTPTPDPDPEEPTTEPKKKKPGDITLPEIP